MDDNKDRYYEGGVSSVYFWDVDDGFAGVVLLKKSILLSRRFCTRAHSLHDSQLSRLDQRATEAGIRYTSSKPSTEHAWHTTSSRLR